MAVKKWKPNKTTKPMLYFDLKNGRWYGDAKVMREAIKRGLTKANGLRFGKNFLGLLFKVAEKELLVGTWRVTKGGSK